MNNHDFYNCLQDLVKDEVVTYIKGAKTLPGYLSCKIGNRTLFITSDRSEIKELIQEKNFENDFFTQHQAEVHFKGSHTMISGMVRKRDLLPVKIGEITFYVVNDWE